MAAGRWMAVVGERTSRYDFSSMLGPWFDNTGLARESRMDIQQSKWKGLKANE